MLKRLFALMMAILLLCSASLAEGTQTDSFFTRTADPSTLDSWQALFGPGIPTTANVGTVWTDKTVTTAVPGRSEFSGVRMTDDQGNFLVTLSAMSATKSITGHDTLPTDTVFVLDLSSSMYRIGTNHYSTSVVGPMIDAANEAIHKLLSLNPLNRVGVVIYYGNSYITPQSDGSHYVPLLKLDSFVPRAQMDYLIMQSPGDKLAGIIVNAGLQTRSGADVVARAYTMPETEHANVAGTYMQLGVKQALEMMLAADPVIPPTEAFQAGATRIPIMVLMSDGEPTAADNEFARVGTADMGNNAVGERSPAETDFLTQLTAAMARELLDMHYGETTPLFYTLGLGNSLSYDVMDPHNNDVLYAGASSATYTSRTGRSVAGYDPGKGNTHPDYQNTDGEVNAKIKDYWADILSSGGRATLTYLLCSTSEKWLHSQTIDVSKVSSYTTGENKTFTFSAPFPWRSDQKYYVDKFFSAETAGDLSAAFTSLVEEIELQSAYFPTCVENGAIGMSGYLEFHDEIGDMLEVKAVHGLVHLGSDGTTVSHYQGEGLAEYVQTCIDNGGSQLAELKVVLGKLLQARLHQNEAQAQAIVDLILDAENDYASPMLYYSSARDYSNVIRWYARADGTYCGLATGAEPSGAACLMESHWYADTSSPAALEDYNAILRIRTDLTTGKQCVMWSVPASMIPLVRYEVTLTGNSLEDPGEITVGYRASNPMRAVFEVGLRSGINRYNAAEYLTDAGYTPGADGKFTFFSNQWTPGALPDPDSGDIHAAGNTTSRFRPSRQNERYNITSDTPLYVKDGSGYKLYAGDARPDQGGEYFVAVPVFRVSGQDAWAQTNHAELTLSCLQIGTGLENAHREGSQWYIKTGTATCPEMQTLPKAENTTASLPCSFCETARDEEHVTAILGNNGTFSFVPDTGMTITKKVTGDDDAGQDFTFVITPASGVTLAESCNVTWLDADSQVLPDGEAVTVHTSGNTLTVTLQAGQSVYIPGLPAGSYTVEELLYGADGTYTCEVSEVKVGGAVRDPAAVSEVVVTDRQMVAVEYTNRKATTGSIRIEKAVTTSMAGVTLPAGQAFTFEADLGADNANKPFTLTTADNTTQAVTADASGRLTFSVMADKPVILRGIPKDTPVTVTEIDLPAGYQVQGENPLTAVVAQGQTATFSYTNVYDAEDAFLDFSGTKTLFGRPLAEGEFTFTLYAADTAFHAGQAIQTVANDADGAFAFSRIVYDQIGTYCYVLREDPAPADCIISDAAEYQIQVDVWNNDGVLVSGCSVHRMVGSDRTPVDLLTDGLTFTNHYVPGSVRVPLTGVKLYEGAPLTEGLFTFQLFAADERFSPAAAPLESVTNAADGAFAFTPRTFSSAGVYRFVVVEDASAALQDVTYDPTVYHVTVTVTDNGSGHLSASTDIRTGDGLAADQLAFENIHLVIPDTGDHSGTAAWSALCLASLAGMLILVLTLRRRSRV